MTKKLLGLDIGGSTVKLAVVDRGRVEKLVAETMPDHLVQESRIISTDALAQELKAALHSQHITTRHCALVLPASASFTRKITMPYMTVDQLRVNLPYEFHDYIHNDKDLYFYDYAVVAVHADEAGTPRELELLAAAVPKATIADYRTMLRKAGLKLTVAVPEYLAAGNLIRDYEAREKEHPSEYCLVDMGHSAIRVHMYRGAVYETSRIIEYGGATLDALIADAVAVDPHLAADYKRTNYAGAQELPACRELYARIAVEILRAVNFYGFNTPDADLRDVWFGGGLAKVSALMEEIGGALELNVHKMQDLLPGGGEEPCAPLCAAAVGVTLQTDGRERT